MEVEENRIEADELIDNSKGRVSSRSFEDVGDQIGGVILLSIELDFWNSTKEIEVETVHAYVDVSQFWRLKLVFRRTIIMHLRAKLW